MADINRIKKRKAKPEKAFSIKTAEILNFGVEGSPAVLLVNKRTVDNASSKSTAKEIQDHAKNSPWSEDKLSGEFAKQSQKTSVDVDPVKELQKFVGAISKG